MQITDTPPTALPAVLVHDELLTEGPWTTLVLTLLSIVATLMCLAALWQGGIQ